MPGPGGSLSGRYFADAGRRFSPKGRESPSAAPARRTGEANLIPQRVVGSEPWPALFIASCAARRTTGLQRKDSGAPSATHTDGEEPDGPAEKYHGRRLRHGIGIERDIGEQGNRRYSRRPSKGKETQELAGRCGREGHGLLVPGRKASSWIVHQGGRLSIGSQRNLPLFRGWADIRVLLGRRLIEG
jgi:hypothetical protein